MVGESEKVDFRGSAFAEAEEDVVTEAFYAAGVGGFFTSAWDDSGGGKSVGSPSRTFVRGNLHCDKDVLIEILEHNWPLAASRRSITQELGSIYAIGRVPGKHNAFLKLDFAEIRPWLRPTLGAVFPACRACRLRRAVHCGLWNTNRLLRSR